MRRLLVASQGDAQFQVRNGRQHAVLTNYGSYATFVEWWCIGLYGDIKYGNISTGTLQCSKTVYRNRHQKIKPLSKRSPYNNGVIYKVYIVSRVLKAKGKNSVIFTFNVQQERI